MPATGRQARNDDILIISRTREVSNLPDNRQTMDESKRNSANTTNQENQRSLTLRRLRSALGPHTHYFSETGSTNDLLREMAVAGAPAGTLVLADFQRTGKGRLDRRWHVPPGTSLLFSLLFRPGWPAIHASWLTMMAGLAAVEAIAAALPAPAASSLQPALKWPNDIMLPVTTGWAKVGGILLETSVTGDRLEQAILGMGLNVNIPPEALPETASPATSLLAATGRPVARLPLLLTLVQRLDHYYQAASRGESPQPAWNERLLTRERVVQISGGGETLTGIALGTDEWGRLLVKTTDGEVHAFAAGDVTLRPGR